MFKLFILTKNNIYLSDNAFPVVIYQHHPYYLSSVNINFIFKVEKLLLTNHSQQLAAFRKMSQTKRNQLTTRRKLLFLHELIHSFALQEHKPSFS
jgi:hypothetical protein